MSTQRLAIERPVPFRRRRFAARRRRRSTVWLLARSLCLAVCLVAGPVGAVVWVAQSPRFRLSEVQVLGTERVATDRVAAALLPLHGRHLLALSLVDVQSRLLDNRWIEGATIQKQLPDRLVVEIHERRPVALLRRDDQLLYIDRTGVVIAPYDPAGPVDLVLLSTAPGAELRVEEAMELAGALARSAPRWGAGLSEIEVLGEGDFRVHTSALPFALLVSTGEVERQIRKLERVLVHIVSRYQAVTAVDLRFSEQIVIQPAGEPRSHEG